MSKAKYVEGFVIVIPKSKVNAYKKIAAKACKIWLEYGALDYAESVGDDLNVSFGFPFPKLTKIKKNETIVFSWICYKSKAQRNSINKKVMKDPRLANMGPEQMPFDMKKMSYGGFNILVSSSR